MKKRAVAQRKARVKKPMLDELPLFCDFTCRFAAFAPADVSGACRREQAVYCRLAGRFNNKLNRCLRRP